MKKNLIYLIAFPGVGKMTIANEICKKKSYILQDNHKTINLLLSFLDSSKGIPEDTWKDVMSIRGIVYDFIKRNFNKDSSLIFTDCLRENDDLAYPAFKEVESIAKTLNLNFYPIFLSCNIEENKKRIKSEDRKKNHKLTKFENSFFERTNLIKVDHENQIHIDVSNLSAKEAAEEIIKKTKKNRTCKTEREI